MNTTPSDPTLVTDREIVEAFVGNCDFDDLWELSNEESIRYLDLSSQLTVQGEEAYRLVQFVIAAELGE